MSDPVTNVEIEDVLSSIRKLVAEESRTAPAVRKPAEPERLVLTPAQRVKEPPKPAEPAEPVVLSNRIDEAAPAPKPVAERPIDDIPGDARLAEYGDVEGAFPDIDVFEAQHAEETPEDTSLDTAEEPVSEMHDRVELGRMIEQEVAAALAVGQPESDEDAEGDADEEIASFHDSDDDIDWDALELPEDPSEPEPDPEIAGEDTDMTATDEALAEEDSAEVFASAEPEQPPQTLEDKVAALGRLVARDTGEFEEERDAPIEAAETVTPDPVAWLPEADHAAPAAHMDPRDVASASDADMSSDPAQPADQGDAPFLADDPQDDMSENQPDALTDPSQSAAFQIDEDELRALVGDIVRQELQGALGERITRNVRKLVRREIHRMLISQELE
ncbi:hypothetical protein MWU54_03885 [Marivita sp. S6314]|uniref:hypothetical protein n=1 Tax=Marivita sp. S6314 TaxID=2926406 RepID=UPI001FF54DFC|nr:hypothetical protein [Marivita sp. S6314]MCK0149150.1 hypothetical protein [Marivita sp. S6314]